MSGFERLAALPASEQTGLINSRRTEMGIPAPSRVAVLSQVIIERAMPAMLQAAVASMRIKCARPSSDPFKQEKKARAIDEFTEIQRINYVAATVANIILAVEEGVQEGSYNYAAFVGRQRRIGSSTTLSTKQIVRNELGWASIDEELWRKMSDLAEGDPTLAAFFDPERSILPDEIRQFLHDNPSLAAQMPQFVKNLYKPLADVVTTEPDPIDNTLDPFKAFIDTLSGLENL